MYSANREGQRRGSRDKNTDTGHRAVSAGVEGEGRMIWWLANSMQGKFQSLRSFSLEIVWFQWKLVLRWTFKTGNWGNKAIKIKVTGGGKWSVKSQKMTEWEERKRIEVIGCRRKSWCPQWYELKYLTNCSSLPRNKWPSDYSFASGHRPSSEGKFNFL